LQLCPGWAARAPQARATRLGRAGPSSKIRIFAPGANLNCGESRAVPGANLNFGESDDGDTTRHDATTGWVGLDWVGLDWIGLGWDGFRWVGFDWVGLGYNYNYNNHTSPSLGRIGLKLGHKIKQRHTVMEPLDIKMHNT
jgi:hypothetical protein